MLLAVSVTVHRLQPVQCSQALQLLPTAFVLPSAGDAFRLALRDNSPRSITGRLPNARELARDSSSRDMAFLPRMPQLPFPRPSPQGIPDGPTLSQPVPPVQPQRQSRGAPQEPGAALVGGAAKAPAQNAVCFSYPRGMSGVREPRCVTITTG